MKSILEAGIYQSRARHNAKTCGLQVAREIVQLHQDSEKRPSIEIGYDLAVSPPTFADLLEVVLVSRLLEALGFPTSLKILHESFRHDWLALSPVEINRTVSQFQGIVKRLAPTSLAGSQAEMVLQTHRAFKGVPLYYGAPWLTLGILKLLGEDNDDSQIRNLRESMYFSASNIATDSGLQDPYVTLHIRQSKWTPYGNTSLDDLGFLVRHIEQTSPNATILTVSSSSGQMWIESMRHHFDARIVTSREIGSRDFLSDAAAVLSSQRYFQYNWGGMWIIPYYSNVPFEMAIPAPHFYPGAGFRHGKPPTWRSDLREDQVLSGRRSRPGGPLLLNFS